MDLITGIFTYLIIWWLTLFMVLPLGVESVKKVKKGHDAGAPAKPDLKKKIKLNTALAFVVWLIIFIIAEFNLLPIREWFTQS